MEADTTSQKEIDVYIEVLTAIVQRFVKLMGEPALKLARRVYGLRVNEDGQVSGYQGDGMVVVQGLVIEYMTLLGSQAVPLSQRAIDGPRQRNPNVKLPSLLK
jgi:hypothetical protein